MNLMVVGVSHRTAPVAALERLAVTPGQVPPLLDRLLRSPYVGEALVLSTCNRVELYTGVSAFHGGLRDVVATLAEHAGYTADELAGYLSVHYDGDAVRHAYEVATGLDSMVVGEAQILGQLRAAYAEAAARDSTGRLLHELIQQALRVGKRAHTETGIDRAGQTMVSAALALAGDLAGRRALVIGAGAMGSLALATLRRAGVGELLVTNRGEARARRLAQLHAATPVPFAELAAELAGVDVVVSATASLGYVITGAHLPPAGPGRPLTMVDLALPRDVDPALGTVDGVDLIDIERVGTELHRHPELTADRDAVATIVAAEVDAFLGWLRSTDVAPTVAALRARADELVGTELARLAARCPDLTAEQQAEIGRTVHRVVQRLLHSPTVRVRQLAAEPGGDQYAALLRDLFDLSTPAGDTVAGLDPRHMGAAAPEIVAAAANDKGGR